MMRAPLIAALALSAVSFAPQVQAAATNLYECSGANGVYGYESTPIPSTAFRTGAGLPAWTVRGISDVDTLTPGQDGVLWATHRQSTDALGHALVFNDSGNNLEYQRNAAAQFTVGSVSANTPFGWSISSAGNGGDITIRIATVASPTTSTAASGASGGSSYDDGQPAEVMFCGYESGGTIFQELDGQSGMFMILLGVADNEADFETWLADPLNVGDLLMDQNGTNAYWWDDSGTDQGGNAVGTLTLATMALGSGNGPDIPDRAAPPAPSGGLLMISRRRQ